MDPNSGTAALAEVARATVQVMRERAWRPSKLSPSEGNTYLASIFFRTNADVRRLGCRGVRSDWIDGVRRRVCRVAVKKSHCLSKHGLHARQSNYVTHIFQHSCFFWCILRSDMSKRRRPFKIKLSLWRKTFGIRGKIRKTSEARLYLMHGKPLNSPVIVVAQVMFGHLRLHYMKDVDEPNLPRIPVPSAASDQKSFLNYLGKSFIS